LIATHSRSFVPSSSAFGSPRSRRRQPCRQSHPPGRQNSRSAPRDRPPHRRPAARVPRVGHRIRPGSIRRPLSLRRQTDRHLRRPPRPRSRLLIPILGARFTRIAHESASTSQPNLLTLSRPNHPHPPRPAST
jgi:hypothetical protein